MRSHRFTSCLTLLFSLLIVSLPAISSKAEDDKKDKIGDMIEEIERREKEKKEKEKNEEDNDDDDSGGSCIGIMLGSCFENCSTDLMFILLAYSTLIEYAPYPYAAGTEFDFSTVRTEDSEPDKRWFAKLTFEPAYLLDDIWGLSARVEAAFSVLYANCMYQYNVSTANWFSVFSINGGLTFPIFNFMVSMFAGGIQINLPSPVVPHSFLFSFGGSVHIFLPGNIVFEFWEINAVSDTLWCFIMSPSLSVAIDRINIGVGFSYSSYIGFDYMGPMLKLSVWL